MNPTHYVIRDVDQQVYLMGKGVYSYGPLRTARTFASRGHAISTATYASHRALPNRNLTVVPVHVSITEVAR